MDGQTQYKPDVHQLESLNGCTLRKRLLNVEESDLLGKYVVQAYSIENPPGPVFKK